MGTSDSGAPNTPVPNLNAVSLFLQISVHDSRVLQCYGPPADLSIACSGAGGKAAEKICHHPLHFGAADVLQNGA